MLAVSLAVASVVLTHARAAAQVEETTELVAMRDGTRLATTIWRPAGATTPLPVLLRRTPYGRAIAADVSGAVVGLGYVLVSQDVRGRGESEGTFSPFRDDAHDGADAIAWIAAQPFSNGRVGTYGGSAEGIVQLMAAGEAPPALRCAMPTVATGDVHEGLYPGGAWRTELGTNWLTGLSEPEALVDFRMHEAPDAYWDPARLDDAEIAGIDVPIFLVGGTFDIFAAGTTGTFEQLRTGSAAGADQFLLFGPWTHGGPGVTTQGEITIPADATHAMFVAELFAFFDWCLRDAARPAWAPVRYYVMRLADDGLVATGEWRDADGWPPRSSAAALAIQLDGTLAPGGLAYPASAEPVALASDPAAAVPSVGGRNLSTPAGPFDQAAIDARDDVFVAQTIAARADVEMTGDVTASVWASSDTTDVDVIVRLSQVTPSGRVMLLADGIRRGRFAASRESAGALTPGEPVLFELDLGPMSFVLPAGHALRASISATSSPRFEPNPGTADPIATAMPRATTLRIWSDAEHPSQIAFVGMTGIEHLGGPPTDGGTSGADAGPMDAEPPSGCTCRVGRGSRLAWPSVAAALLALACGSRRRRAR